jgi:hypothetical protein
MSTLRIRTPGRHRRALVLLLVLGLVVIGSACSRRASHTITTGVEGTISAGPTCPVEHEGQPCAPSPVQAQVTVLATDGRTTAHAASDAKGRFRVSVPPGSYTLHVAVPGPFPACPDTAITVPGEATVTSDILCDTGIR